MKIINLTPHDIIINDVKYEGIGSDAARVEQSEELIEHINNIPVYKLIFSDSINLPDPMADTIFIVSRIVAENNLDRNDLFVTCKPIRDNNGRIIGCRGLSKL